jgi:hypothetical protein
MRLQDGKVIVNDLESQGIEFLTGEMVPVTGIAPRELKTRISNALARRRFEEPDADLFWSIIESCVEDLNRLLAVQ